MWSYILGCSSSWTRATDKILPAADADRERESIILLDTNGVLWKISFQWNHILIISFVLAKLMIEYLFINKVNELLKLLYCNDIFQYHLV